MSTSSAPKGALSIDAHSKAPIRVQLVGGPTALIEIGGLQLLTDPTFDPPGDYPVGQRALVKTIGPAVSAQEIGRVDVVLLSHHHHPDNLDGAGRRLLDQVPLVLSTGAAAKEIGGTTEELQPWRSVTVGRPDDELLRITGAPAKHGPDGTEDVTGEVRGFVPARTPPCT